MLKSIFRTLTVITLDFFCFCKTAGEKFVFWTKGGNQIKMVKDHIALSIFEYCQCYV